MTNLNLKPVFLVFYFLFPPSFSSFIFLFSFLFFFLSFFLVCAICMCVQVCLDALTHPSRHMWRPLFDIRTFLWSLLSIYNRLVLIQYSWQSKLTIRPIKLIISLLGSPLAPGNSLCCLLTTFSYSKSKWNHTVFGLVHLFISRPLQAMTYIMGTFWCSSWRDLCFSGYLEALAVRVPLKLTVLVFFTHSSHIELIANTQKGQPQYHSSEPGICFFLLSLALHLYEGCTSLLQLP